MNTANLQLEGLYTAMQSVLCALRDKDLITADEIDRALAEAETVAGTDPRRPTELSGANREAVLFPIRYLRVANRLCGTGPLPTFSEVATRVGRENRPGA
ncbi:hypothetical protein GTW51_09015 [Aurantimonas aggregata]|uniref:Uncharacterized protein n=1 Tax=Aurantimonas aggregata TaxID=2047720 RepID=A0A6L9MGZ7_9HYPH|nr:hypothetical protein [Aurantimonas aggregata]NDV86842.1 hypothetical protein [Aurantimonas aggregata]